jgi:hypothetical protein
VVHPITFTDSTTQGSWVGLSAANLTSLFGGLLYLNVHSTNYSGGEIRGMVLPIGSALPTAVNAAPSVTPAQFRLEQNYPNPFNPSTTIEYTVGGVGIQASGVSLVRLSVYDVLGRQVAVLVDGAQAAGNYRVTFDASGLPSGVYLYRLSAGSATVQTKTMTIMK